ncbi:unnamed protein product [Anisakis simplex]|uniref:Uncharacterized protein n=1 Tax=Anisakis simplex TaxID=6269 RepID=A0A3P6TJC5_ANISI|nr:unnamed protein product [Anisakis simplex]
MWIVVEDGDFCEEDVLDDGDTLLVRNGDGVLTTLLLDFVVVLGMLLVPSAAGLPKSLACGDDVHPASNDAENR